MTSPTPPTATPEAVAKMIHTLSIALSAARDCEYTTGHTILWAALLSMVAPLSNFRHTAEAQRFLSFDPYLYLTEIGLVIYTVSEDGLQINLNLVIPRDPTMGLPIIDSVLGLLTRTYRDAVLNLRPLCTHFFLEEDAGVSFREKRRFITGRRQVPHMVFDEERQMVRLARQTVRATLVLRDTADVAQYRPAATLSSSDPPGTLYWHAFYDGFAERFKARPGVAPRLVVFPNPQVDMHPGIVWPDVCLAPAQLIASVHSDFHPLFRGFFAEHPMESLVALRCELIVPCAAHLVLSHARRRFGLSDVLIEAAGDMLDRRPGFMRVAFMEQVATVWELIARSRLAPVTVGHLDLFCDVLNDLERSSSYASDWRDWAVQSPYLSELLADTTREAHRRVCRRCAWLRAAAARSLRARASVWTREEAAKATDLLEDHAAWLASTDAELCDRLAAALADVRAHAEHAAIELGVRPLASPPPSSPRTRPPAAHDDDDQEGTRGETRGETETEAAGEAEAEREETGGPTAGETAALTQAMAALTTSKKKRQRRAASKKAAAAAAVAAAVDRDATHHDIARRVAASTGWPCELIGSGIFSDRSDADVVLTVPADTLEAAYEKVRAATGWSPMYDHVSEDHVAVLRGVVNGTSVDAQVRREQGDDEAEAALVARTPAEEETDKAVRLAHRLSVEADAACRTRVRGLHAWVAAASLKGHRLCRLPGVAATCTAVVLACDGGGRGRDPGLGEEATLRPVLEALRDVLLHPAPVVDFDRQEVAASSAVSSRDRPCANAPLRVRVDGVNVASRMTRATTRHLLDMVLFALQTPAPMRLDPSLYMARRCASMIPAARVRPHGARDVAYSLHAAVEKLSGHPLVESLHVTDDEDEDGTLCLWVGLDRRADATRYGFRDGDRVHRAGPGAARVTRRGRQWPLALAACAAADTAWAARATVADLLPVAAGGEAGGGDCGGAVPNAPYLSVDVIACFDGRAWDVVAP